MANVKTAVSLQKELFERAEALAHEMKVSRSRIFVMALEDFLQKHTNKQLLDQINEAYEEGPDPEEREVLTRMRRLERRLVERDCEW